MKRKIRISFIIIIVSLIIAGGILILLLNIKKPFNKDLITYNPDFSETKDYDNGVNENESLIGEYAIKIAAENIASDKQEEESKIIETDAEKEQILDNSSDEETKKDNKESKTNNNVAKTNTNTKDNTNKSNNNSNITTDTKASEKIEKTNKTNNHEKKQENNTTKNEQENKQETNITKPNKEEKQEPVQKRCTNNSNHGMNVGNSNKWFSTKSEAIDYYNSQIHYWGKLWENFEIEDDVYYKNCPSGYEVWSCMYCSKWTINFYFR